MVVPLDRSRTAASSDGWRLLFWIVFGRSRNPMALVSLDRRLLAVNPAAIALSGRPREAMIGRDLDAVLIPVQPKTLDYEWSQLRREGSFEGERTVITARDERVTIQYALRMINIDGDDVILAVVLDSSAEPMSVHAAPRTWQASMLSPRELEIVGLVAMGLRAHEIAGELGIERSTVRTHLRNALRKTGSRSQAQLVALVLAGHVPAAAVPATAATYN